MGGQKDGQIKDGVTPIKQSKTQSQYQYLSLCLSYQT